MSSASATGQIATGLLSGISEGISSFQESSQLKDQGRIARGLAYREAGQFRKQGASLLSGQRAEYAHGGIDVSSGTPIQVLNDTATELRIKEQMIKYAGEEEYAKYRNAASKKKVQGISQIIGSTAKVASMAAVDYKEKGSMLTDLFKKKFKPQDISVLRSDAGGYLTDLS